MPVDGRPDNRAQADGPSAQRYLDARHMRQMRLSVPLMK
jgi:hypothetical protein